MRDIRGDHFQLNSCLYLQVSIISQALIFVTRSQSFSFFERPGTLLMIAFALAQLVSPSRPQPPSLWLGETGPDTGMSCRVQVATFLTVYANWGFANIKGVGWGWAGVIWLFE